MSKLFIQLDLPKLVSFRIEEPSMNSESCKDVISLLTLSSLKYTRVTIEHSDGITASVAEYRASDFKILEK